MEINTIFSGEKKREQQSWNSNSSYSEEKAFIKNSILYGTSSGIDMKVYILDEVADHIQRYAGTGLKYELGGVLLGHFIPNDENDVLIVSGVLDAKHTEASDTMLDFTIKTWESIQREKEAFYEDTEIVGWFSIRPSRGNSISSDDSFIKNNFSDFLWQVACVVDAVSENKQFYLRENNSVNKCRGYYIYSKTKNLTDSPPIEERLSRSGFIKANPILSERDKGVEDFGDVEDFRDVESSRDVEASKANESAYKNPNSESTHIHITKSTNLFNNIIYVTLFGLIITLAFGYYSLNSKYSELSKQLQSAGIPIGTAFGDGDSEIKSIRQDIEEIQEKYEKLSKEIVDNFDNRPNNRTNNSGVKQAVELPANNTTNTGTTNTSATNTSTTNTSTTNAVASDENQTEKKTESVKFENYTVKNGDTLWGLGIKFYGDGMKHNLIMEANGITDIMAGQTIKIPK